MRAERSPEQRATYTLKLTLRLMELFPPLREAVRPHGLDGLLEAYGYVSETVQLYRQAWEAHPDFAFYAADERFRFSTLDPLDPVAVAVYRHPPARRGRTASFIISHIGDLLNSKEHEYGKNRLGDLECIAPIGPDWPTHPTRILTIDNSYGRGGHGFVCRMNLKALLPRELRPWIGRVRDAHRWRKSHYLSAWMRARWPNGEMSERELMTEHKDLLPAWYTSQTKMELAYARFEEEDPAGLRAIEAFIDFENLWLVCTNKVMPEDLAGLLKQQQLFQIERLPRARGPKARSDLSRAISRVLAEQQRVLFEE